MTNFASKKIYGRALALLALGAFTTLAVVGIVHASDGFFTSKDCPPLAALQAKYADLMNNGCKLDSIVGKARAGTDSWMVYYFRSGSDGKLQIDNDIVLTKLDTDVWIMKAGNFMGSGERWGIVSGVPVQVAPK